MLEILPVLQSGKVKRVLDVGAGSGYMSLLCASYGAIVDAVDPGTLWPMWQWSPYLERHPSIHYHQMSILDFVPEGPYDLIIMQRVINFLPREEALKTLLPRLSAATTPWGTWSVVTIDPSPEAIANDPGFRNTAIYTPDEIIEATWFTLDMVHTEVVQLSAKKWPATDTSMILTKR